MDFWTIGTSSAVPTRKRGLPANMVNYEGERIMFDCGEGAQRQIMQGKMGLMKISRIFISHWHADHFSGLLGLIQTLEMEGREHPLYIYGPPRTEEFTEKILDTGYFNRNYDIFVEDLVEGDEIIGEGYKVKPFEVEHGINAFGFTFQEDSHTKANKEKMKKLDEAIKSIDFKINSYMNGLEPAKEADERENLIKNGIEYLQNKEKEDNEE